MAGTTDPRDTAAEQARNNYIAGHPEPGHHDFTCPRCKATVGRPCTLRWSPRPSSLPVHAPRYDKWRRAHARWTAEAADAYRRAWEAWQPSRDDHAPPR